MNIRKATPSDLPEIEKIYACAREQMRKNGNPTQWGDSYPAVETIKADIEQGNGYVVLNGGEICGVFAFIIGEDPTYKIIEGSWLNNEKYGTIHRVAGSGKAKGVLNAAVDFCSGLEPNIRIDTHSDNKIMQYLLEKLGFVKCGIIYVSDGTPRFAYQKLWKATEC